MPTIFVTRDVTWKQGIFNACAQKLFASSGAIVIGQKLLRETTDAELEAVVAHELGHIKYNHVNKRILLSILTIIATNTLNGCLPSEKKLSSTTSFLIKLYLPDLIINKRFEKQADEFAYKFVGKANGTIAFHENLIKRNKKYFDEDFEKTYDILQKNKPQLAILDRYLLTTRYYLASFFNKLNKTYRWIYLNTPLGAHPSSEERIQAVKDYLAQKEASTKQVE